MPLSVQKRATCLVSCAISAMCLLETRDSWATTCTMAAPPITLPVKVPSVLAVPKNTPNGTLLYSSPDVQVTDQARYRCNGGSPWGYVNALGPTYATGPSPIGSTGLAWNWIYYGEPARAYPGGVPVMYAGQNFTGTISSLQIYKVGNVSSGTVHAGTIGSMRAGTNNVDILLMQLTNSMTVTEASCQTPNVNVDLGKRRTSEFKGVGSSVGRTPFKIRLENCPSGITAVSFQLDPVNAPINTTQGLLSIYGGGATGVGIQITDENAQPVTLGQRIRLPGSVPGADVEIPLYASYYKTAQQVGGGLVSAAMQFTITYQ